MKLKTPVVFHMPRFAVMQVHFTTNRCCEVQWILSWAAQVKAILCSTHCVQAVRQKSWELSSVGSPLPGLQNNWTALTKGTLRPREVAGSAAPRAALQHMKCSSANWHNHMSGTDANAWCCASWCGFGIKRLMLKRCDVKKNKNDCGAGSTRNVHIMYFIKCQRRKIWCVRQQKH